MIDKGITASDMATIVLGDLSDPNQNRWTAAKILNLFNEGIRDLAGENCFKRADLHVPTANQSYFETFAELRQIERVEYNGKKTLPVEEKNAECEIGADWRTATGTPEYYMPDKAGVRIIPPPSSAGTALSFTGSPAITETEGGTILGDGYTGALNSTTVVHFKPGDGEVTNETAENNLLISYYFYPRPISLSTSIPQKYSDGLVAYATWRCFALSEVDEEEQGKGMKYQSIWLLNRAKIIKEAQGIETSEQLANQDMKVSNGLI